MFTNLKKDHINVSAKETMDSKVMSSLLKLTYQVNFYSSHYGIPFISDCVISGHLNFAQ